MADLKPQDFNLLNQSYRDFLKFRGGAYPTATQEEREDLNKLITQYRTVQTLSRRIKPEASQNIQEQVLGEDKDPSVLHSILKTADMGRNLLAKNIFVPLLGLKEELGNKETVTTEDMLAELGMADTWVRTGLGLAGDVLTDPITYFLPYARIAKAGTAIATSAGERILLPKGMQFLKGLNASELMTRGFKSADDLVKAVGTKEAERITGEIGESGLKKMSSLIDAKHADITPDMFYAGAAYFHPPMTKIYKKLFSYEIPKRLMDNMAALPQVDKFLGPAYKEISRYTQPVTVGLMRTAGHFGLKVEQAKDLSYATGLSNIDVAEAFGRKVEKNFLGFKYKKYEPYFPDKESALRNMEAFEEYQSVIEAKTKAKMGKPFLPKRELALKDEDFLRIAQETGMSPDDMYETFQGHFKLADKLKALIEEQGATVNEFAGFYVPHLAKVSGAYEVFPSGNISAITFSYKRDFKTIKEFREYLAKHQYNIKINSNPYETWSLMLTAARKMNAVKKYEKALTETGVIERIAKPNVINAATLKSDLKRDLLPYETIDLGKQKVQHRLLWEKLPLQLQEWLKKRVVKTQKTKFGTTTMGGEVEGYFPTERGILSDEFIVKNLPPEKFPHNEKQWLKMVLDDRNTFPSLHDDIMNYATSRYYDEGRPLLLNLGKKDFRLLDERGRWGSIAFDSYNAANEAYRGGTMRRISEFETKNILTKNIGGVWYKGRTSDMLDLEDSLIKNVPPGYRQAVAKGWNWATAKFKYWATVGGGQWIFMSRNLISDMARTFYDNTIRTLNPKLHDDAITIFTGYSPLRRTKVDLDSFYKTNELGQVVSGTTIRQQYIENGLMSFDLQKWDVKTFTSEISRQKGLPGTRILKNYFNFLGKSNVFVENHSKMVNFIADWQKGLSFSKSAELTHEFLYNYKLLPKAVQGSLGMFPFGRWAYLNTLGMVKRFVDAPGKQVSLIRAMGTAEEIVPEALMAAGGTAKPLTEQERKALPKFYQEDVAIPLYRMASGATGLLTSFDLPISEFNEMGLFQGVRGIVKSLGAKAPPAVKSFGEYAMDWDIFFEAPLRGIYESKETGETKYPYHPDVPFAKIPGIGDLFGKIVGAEKVKGLSGDIRYKADPSKMKLFQAATGGILSRPISEIGKLTDLPFGATALRMMTGTKIYEKDLMDFQRQRFKKNVAQIRNLMTQQRQKEKYEVK
uniref:Large polyvalent protein associated domain-containing protein n=1 Tax=viral metagenome TaxID=1070528 RepID=A0A6M3XCA6_9ZZZZ